MALENRSEMDHAALEAQELWLACSALQSAIEKDGGDGSEVGIIQFFWCLVGTAYRLFKFF